ncbi:MAG: hypothetical protein ABSH50_07215 [Bryobacteraceae bacterium]|jgi:hypothetical protein
MTFGGKALHISVAIGYLSILGQMPAATKSTTTTTPSITYQASGTFAAAPVTGSDTLKLAGEPFTVSVVVSEAAKPSKTGSNYAVYSKLRMTGTVSSGLLGPTPVAIASSEASIQQAISPGKNDQFILEAPIKVVGLSLTIKAVITMPLGTITKPELQPFSATVNLVSSDAAMTYSDSNASTELGIQTGTLTGKL